MSVTMSDMNEETLIQAMKKSISMPPDTQLTLSEGITMSLKEAKFWILLDEEWVDKYFQLYPNNNRKAELVRWLRSKFPPGLTKNCRDNWYVDELEKMVNLERVEHSFQAVVHENGHKFTMTEGEYNLWKDMDEQLKDVLIQIIPDKAEVVGRLRSEAREGKAKAGSPGHTNPETGGGSSTAQNEPPPNHQDLPVVGDQQVHNVTDIEPAEHTSPQTGGGSSTAQNEPPPNHQVPLVVADHQGHNVQVNESLNQNVNYAAEFSIMEAGRFSTQADNEPAPDKCGHEIVFMVAGQSTSIFLAVISVKKSSGKMTIEAKVFLYFLMGFFFVSIISLPYGLCLSGGGGRGRRSIVARVVKAVSYVATGLAVVTAAGLQLPNLMMVWVTPLAWVIIAPAIVCYAMKQ